MHDLAPDYIADVIKFYRNVAYTLGRQLRSAGRRHVREQRHNLERYSRRGFSVTAPHLWDNVPYSLRLIDSLELFKSNLKTNLFKEAFLNYLYGVL